MAKPAGAAERALQPAPQQPQHSWRQRSPSKRWQPQAESGGWSQSLLPVYGISVVAARAMCKYKVSSPPRMLVYIRSTTIFSTTSTDDIITSARLQVLVGYRV